MIVLPLIDLLILCGWTTLSIGAVLKAVYVTTSYRPTLIGLGPLDCALVAGGFLLLALALAARTWVKLNEPKLHAVRRGRAPGAYEDSENAGRVEPASSAAPPLEAASVRGAGGAG